MPLLKYDGTPAAETAAAIANFYGGDGVDTLNGTGAAETFWGGQGDLMIGGGGDDTYFLKDHKDRIVEQPGGGVDKIVAWQNVYLGDYPNIENVSVSGDNVYAAGDAGDNIVEGGAGSQQLYGGGGGQDVLIGGAGADTFIVVKGEGNDVIQDFNAAEDRVRLKAGFTSFDQVKAHMTQVGADVKLDLGGADGLMFRNITVDKFTAANFQLQLDPATLGARTFADEFNGPLSIWDAESNPRGTWRPDYGYQGSQGAGSYTLMSNSEQQIYTSPYFRDHGGDFSESPFVSNPDGTLSIWAKPSSNSEIFGYHYTSGLISTAPSLAQTYGYFEMRAELPHAAGAWPAFWLIPADGSWPPELDIMETLTSDPRAAWTTEHSNVGGSHTSMGFQNFVPDTADGFHTYGALWTPSNLVWYIDGVEVFRTATPADMNKPMYMIANMAMGGWGGTIDPAGLPAQMKIDYIHAFALPTGGTAAPPPAPPTTTGGGGVAPPVSIDADKTLVGLAGGDTLQGGSGNDTLQGGDGSNYLRGGDGGDSVAGGSGFDDINGNKGDDTIHGNGGDDWVVGGQGNDLVYGDDGNDIVLGNLGNDTLDGGTGNDLIRGGQGDDVLRGGAGDDWLSGDRGNDTLTGGAGADIFHSFSGAGVDLVTDFNQAEGDRVQLDRGTAYTLKQVGDDTVIDMGGGDQLILAHVQLSSLTPGWLFEA